MASLGESIGAPRLSVGQELLDGRLVVRGVLGRGATGVVYRADDRRLSRQVALKTLVSFNGEQLYRLKRGFRTLAGVSHRNLVQLYELGAANDELWFLTMELLEGSELGGWLRQRPSRQRLLHVFGELGEGLRVLHAAGLMHCDVKPANVMVTPGDHAVLLDFGLLAPIRGTGMTDAGGTLDYIAPEQLWGESPGAPADWYSFGVMLYEALTGRLPFTGSDRVRAKERGLSAGPRELAPDTPAAIDDLVTRLLDPAPARRPGAAEIAALLEMPAPADAASSPLEPPFIGRDECLRQLHGSLRDVERGRTQVLHVHGPSGIGKTALARHFLSQVKSEDGVLVLEGHCHPQESVPYKALDGVIDNLARHLLSLDDAAVLTMAPRHALALLRVFPVLGRVPAVREWQGRRQETREMSPADLRRRGGDALREVLVKLSDRQPVVIWIDDIQWSDRDSGAMLHALLNPPDEPRLLLLLTSRDEPGADQLLRALPELLPRTGLAIERLTADESRQLAGALVRDAHVPADIESLAAEGIGSPFLLGELVRYLRDTADEKLSGPFSIAHALRSRFHHLDAEPRRLLEFVAIAGKPLDIDLALNVAGLDPSGRLLAYSLCANSLLRISTQDERQFLETYHDRLREFAIEDMGIEAKRTRHYALAKAIEGSRTPDARALVRHFLEADTRDEAAHYAVLAAQESARDLAFDQAVEMYDVALAHEPTRGDRKLLEQRADMLAYAGRRTDSALAYEDAARAVEEIGESRTTLRVQAAEQFLYGGELKQGLAVLESVLADVGVRVPGSALGRSLGALWSRARFLARGPRFEPRDPGTLDRATTVRLDALWRTTHGMVMLDPALADVLGGKHLHEALRWGDPSRVLRALGLEAAIEANIGGRWLRRRSWRLLEEADRVALTHGTPYDRAWLAQSRAVCAFCEAKWRESAELGAKAEHLLKETGVGVSWDLTALHGFMLSALANLGELRELTRRVEYLVRDAERRRDQYALRVFRTGDAVLIWLAADQVEMALQLAHDTLRDYDANVFTSQHRHHLVAAVQAYLYAGSPDLAWDQVERAWPMLRRAGFLLMECLGTQLRYLRGCAALAMASASSTASRSRYMNAARHEARWIHRAALPMAPPMGQAIESGIAGIEGRRDAQIELLARAIEGFDRAEMTLHREAAAWHLAGLRGRTESDRVAILPWMREQGVSRPHVMARAIVPAI